TGAAATQPFDANGPAPNDVTAAVFLLMRTQDIGSEVFTCPSSNEERWDFGGGNNTALNWSNWDGRAGIKKYLSYSFANPYVDDAAKALGFRWAVVYDGKESMSAEYAIASDK